MQRIFLLSVFFTFTQWQSKLTENRWRFVQTWIVIAMTCSNSESHVENALIHLMISLFLWWENVTQKVVENHQIWKLKFAFFRLAFTKNENLQIQKQMKITMQQCNWTYKHFDHWMTNCLHTLTINKRPVLLLLTIFSLGPNEFSLSAKTLVYQTNLSCKPKTILLTRNIFSFVCLFSHFSTTNENFI